MTICIRKIRIFRRSRFLLDPFGRFLPGSEEIPISIRQGDQLQGVAQWNLLPAGSGFFKKPHGLHARARDCAGRVIHAPLFYLEGEGVGPYRKILNINSIFISSFGR